MKKCQCRYNKRLTLVGCCLLMGVLGLEWYWGNLRVYVLLYVTYYLNETPSHLQSPWTMSFMEAGWCLGLGMTSVVSKRIGKRLTLILALCIIEAGFVGAYFFISHSLLASDFSLGLVAGFGSYMIYGITLKFALDWSDGQDGMLTSIVQAIYPAGAIFINQVISHYINPDNVRTDKIYGDSQLCSQMELLHRVPYSFLVLAAIILATCVLGILMVRENDQHEEKNEISRCDPEAKNQTTGNSSSNQRATLDVTPRQAARQSYCYIGWYLCFQGHVITIIFATYYKSYGLTRITDDHFITDISAALLLTVVFSRTVTGIALDKVGLKTTYVIISSTCSLACLMFYFSLYVHPWCYVVMTVFLGASGSAMYVLLAFYAIKMFGKTHFLGNFALLMSPTVFSTFALSPLLQFIIVEGGWFYLYGFGSTCSLVALIIVVVKIPNV